MLVKVGKTPGEIREFSIDAGTSVRDALEIANLDATGYEIRVGTTVRTLDYALSSDDSIVLLVKQIKGN